MAPAISPSDLKMYGGNYRKELLAVVRSCDDQKVVETNKDGEQSTSVEEGLELEYFSFPPLIIECDNCVGTEKKCGWMVHERQYCFGSSSFIQVSHPGEKATLAYMKNSWVDYFEITKRRHLPERRASYPKYIVPVRTKGLKFKTKNGEEDMGEIATGCLVCHMLLPNDAIIFDHMAFHHHFCIFCGGLYCAEQWLGRKKQGCCEDILEVDRKLPDQWGTAKKPSPKKRRPPPFNVQKFELEDVEITRKRIKKLLDL